MPSLNSLLRVVSSGNGSYHQLVFMLANKNINETYFPENKNLDLLDHPLREYEIPAFNSTDDLEEISKEEMAVIISKLLEEKSLILKHFEAVDKERKILKEENLNLLRELFELGPDKIKNSGLNAMFMRCLLHSEILKKHIEQMEQRLDKMQKGLKEREDMIETLKIENDKLREKVIKSRVNLKNYLINMPIPYNDDETFAFSSPNGNTKYTNTDSNNAKNTENVDLGLSGSFEKISMFENIPINKCQDWDKQSIMSQKSRLGQTTGTMKKGLLPPTGKSQNKITSYNNIEYQNDKNNSPRKSVVSTDKSLLQKFGSRPKNMSITNQSIPKLALIKENEKRKTVEKNEKGKPSTDLQNSFHLPLDEKSETSKIGSKMKIETPKAATNKNSASTGYLNVPQKVMRPSFLVTKEQKK